VGRGRPRLDLGAWGKIRTTVVALKEGQPSRYRATASYRDRHSGKVAAITATSSTEDKAKKALSAKLRVRTGQGPAAGSKLLTPENTVIQLVERWEEWLYTKSTLAIQSRDRYRRTSRYVVDGYHGAAVGVGGLVLRELSSGRIAQHVYGIAELSVPEARIARAVWGSLMRFALQHDAVPSNLARGAATELANPGRKPPRALTADEGEQLFAALDAATAAVRPGPKTRKGLTDLVDAMTIQLAAGGLRIGEATAICSEDITYTDDGATILIHKSNVYREGSGRKIGPRKWEIPGGWEIQVTTKTHDVSTVHVDAVGTEILRRRADGTRHPMGLLFYSESTWAPLSLSNLRRTLREITGNTDLDWASTHTMRRSVATQVKAVHGIEVASKVMRHTELLTTIRGYIDAGTESPNVTSITQQMHRRKPA